MSPPGPGLAGVFVGSARGRARHGEVGGGPHRVRSRRLRDLGPRGVSKRLLRRFRRGGPDRFERRRREAEKARERAARTAAERRRYDAFVLDLHRSADARFLDPGPYAAHLARLLAMCKPPRRRPRQWWRPLRMPRAGAGERTAAVKARERMGRA